MPEDYLHLSILHLSAPAESSLQRHLDLLDFHAGKATLFILSNFCILPLPRQKRSKESSNRKQRLVAVWIWQVIVEIFSRMNLYMIEVGILIILDLD